MKIDTFTAILSVALAGIIAFFLCFYVKVDNKLLVGIGSFLSMALTLIGTISLSFEYDKTTTLTRTTSGIFFILILISQIVFTSINGFLLPTYILVTGSATIFYTLIVYGISKSKH
jgi:hypothetical protein